jgi:hypothetical protein
MPAAKAHPYEIRLIGSLLFPAQTGTQERHVLQILRPRIRGDEQSLNHQLDLASHMFASPG